MSCASTHPQPPPLPTSSTKVVSLLQTMKLHIIIMICTSSSAKVHSLHYKYGFYFCVLLLSIFPEIYQYILYLFLSILSSLTIFSLSPYLFLFKTIFPCNLLAIVNFFLIEVSCIFQSCIFYFFMSLRSSP